MNYDLPYPNCSRYDDKSECYIRRLHAVFALVSSRSRPAAQAILNRLVDALHDYKGNLVVILRAEAPPWLEELFLDAWERTGEPPENVEFHVLGSEGARWWGFKQPRPIMAAAAA